jgi:F-type H+-transporting ATPase subunit a
MAGSSALDPSHLFGHVQDADYFEVPRFMSPHGSGHIYLPQPLATPLVGPDGKPILGHHGQPTYEVIWQPHTGNKLIDGIFQPFDLKLTKFMVLEVVVALLMAVLFIRLANRMRSGNRPQGRMWNALEAILIYLRDHVAVPAIGSHDARRFLPLVWSVFFFVLGCNLMGLVPWTGSPTGALATTAALAIVTFVTVVGSGMGKLGLVGFWKAQVPPMDLPKPVAIFLIPMIFVIEIMGLLIKHFVLAVRLLANMIGGHMVLAVLLAFITVTAGSMLLWGVVAPASVLGSTAVSLLEVLVAFIQAYIFAFLTALFIGMAVHPH